MAEQYQKYPLVLFHYNHCSIYESLIFGILPVPTTTADIYFRCFLPYFSKCKDLPVSLCSTQMSFYPQLLSHWGIVGLLWLKEYDTFLYWCFCECSGSAPLRYVV